jgi:hypothetical protein
MKPPFFHLAAAIAICIVSFIGYGAWYSAISAKSTAVADLQNKIDTKTETVKRIAATRATLAGVTNDEAAVQSYFVPEASVVSFIDSLQAHGKALGTAVSVLSVSTSGTVAQPSLTLVLTVSGTFDAVMRTVGSIEFAPYHLTISTLSATQDAKNGWHADLKIVVGSVPATRVATSSPTALGPSFSPYAYF